MVTKKPAIKTVAVVHAESTCFCRHSNKNISDFGNDPFTLYAFHKYCSSSLLTKNITAPANFQQLLKNFNSR